MADHGSRTRDVRAAARRFADALADSYTVVYEQTAQAGKRQQQLERMGRKIRSS